MKKSSIIFATVILLFAISLPGAYEITSEIETEFGTYHPYPVEVAPSLRSYTIEQDFSNISNFKDFSLSENLKTKLKENGFAVTASDHKQIYDIYNGCAELGIPIFVTTDAMLHTFHILYDYALRDLEMRMFIENLDKLNKSMVHITSEQLSTASDEKAGIALLKNLAYFSVANKLLDPDFAIPAEVGNLVNRELSLIEAHLGDNPSPIFEYKEDYSQYVPRGHYTRNEDFKKYFKSMMWYGRIAFRIDPPPNLGGPEKGREETLQAILITVAIKGLDIDGEPAMDFWRRIYDPTIFFVGKSDDLTIDEYADLSTQVYGQDYLSLPVDSFADEDKLNEFISLAKELRDPLINSSWVSAADGLESTKGFRFMGQRFIPDSYMFQQLVFDNVLGRNFPKGLDVMAVLGSERAYKILTELFYDEDSYPKYVEQIAKLRQEFSDLSPETWAQNLYWNWIYSLMALLDERGEGFPTFMSNDAWTDKDLNTALGSWAELRHDTILYAKQSYTFETSMPPPLGFSYGYVEPNPWLFGRLASLAELMRTGLESRGLLVGEFDWRLSDLSTLLLTLKAIAEKELQGKLLSQEDYEVIVGIGKRLENLVSFPSDISYENETDSEMAVIADVHTDTNSRQALEEGVGYPLEVYVVAEVGNKLVLTKGGIFSYYEFIQPISDRLTDEAWQEMLKSQDPPQVPGWTSSFADVAEISKPQSPHSVSLSERWFPNVEISIIPEKPNPGDLIQIRASGDLREASQAEAVFRSSGELLATVSLSREGTSQDIVFSGTVPTENWSSGVVEIEIVTDRQYLNRRHWFELGVTSDVGDDSRPPIPGSFSLHSYPNPFGPHTEILFSAPEHYGRTLEAEMTIYNSIGQVVKRLAKGTFLPGRNSIIWDGKDDLGSELPSGAYFCILKTGGHIEKMKIIKLR